MNKPVYMERATSGIDYDSMYIMKSENIAIAILWQHDELENKTLNIFGSDNAVLPFNALIKKGGVDISKDRQHLRNFLTFIFDSRIIKVG